MNRRWSERDRPGDAGAAPRRARPGGGRVRPPPRARHAGLRHVRPPAGGPAGRGRGSPPPDRPPVLLHAHLHHGVVRPGRPAADAHAADGAGRGEPGQARRAGAGRASTWRRDAVRPAEGSAEIDRIAAAPSPYGKALTTVAYGLLSGAACQFLGGGGRESLAAAVLGLGLGIFALLIGALPRIGGVFEPLAAFLVSAAAIGLAHMLGPDVGADRHRGRTHRPAARSHPHHGDDRARHPPSRFRRRAAERRVQHLPHPGLRRGAGEPRRGGDLRRRALGARRRRAGVGQHSPR